MSLYEISVVVFIDRALGSALLHQKSAAQTVTLNTENLFCSYFLSFTEPQFILLRLTDPPRTEFRQCCPVRSAKR